MFDKKYEVPMELFGWQHLTALAVILAVIIILFFTRKLFIKYKAADIAFRWTLVVLLLFFELVPYFKDGPRSLFGVITGSYPLCGVILWFSVIAFAADSERFVKLFYPFAIIGALLSLIVVDMDCSFPHLRAFQFFFTHGCFLIGVLYFVFTRKISKYTLKDLAHSAIFLFILSVFNLIIAHSKISTLMGAKVEYKVEDPYFVLAPPGELMFFKDALGQVGYTIVYVLLIVGILFAIWGITYGCTFKRPKEDLVTTKLSKNKFFDYLSKIPNKYYILGYVVIYGIGVYLVTLAGITNSAALKILNSILFFILVISLVLYELLIKYKMYGLDKEPELISSKEVKTVNEKVDD